MSRTFDGPAGEFEPDPEDWLTTDPESMSPEATANDADDIAAGLADDVPLPEDASEADAVDQRTEAGPGFDDEVEDDDDL
jgi:hypothetical protein